jgi:hypothetical protein
MNATNHTKDPVTATLPSLAAYDVDPARAAHIRARCRAALSGRVDRRREWAGPAPPWRRIVEPALVAGISVAFLVEVIGRALSLEGF